MSVAVAGWVRRAIGGAARDARRAWGMRAWVGLAAVVLAAAVPSVVGEGATADLARGLYLALAAAGLGIAVGLGGLPSLGQGAFMAIGAFGTAILRARWGWDPTLATMAGPLLAAAAGWVVGVAAVRLRPVFVAVATWVVAWLVAFALAAFPGLSGGARGLALPQAALGPPGAALELTPTAHYGLALGLVVALLLLHLGVVRGGPGPALAAARTDPAAAAGLGIAVRRLRLGAFVAAAAIGGIAGSLAVQLAGVADPSVFGPLRSVELLVAVLIGGAGTVLGPVVGAVALAAIGPAAELAADLVGAPSEPLEPVAAAVLLLVALGVGRGGLVGLAGRLGGRRPREAPDRAPDPDAVGEVSLAARGVRRAFGGIVALDDVSLEVAGGRIHAVVGPNGSGKSTLLSVLAGAIPPEAGAVMVDGREVEPAVEARAGAGVVRMLQRTVVFEDLTVLDHVRAGTTLGRSHGGALRAALSTPLARKETAATRGVAVRLLEEVGLGGRAGEPAASLSGGDRRLLMLATALAAAPRVLLLDEPSSGMTAPETAALAEVLERSRRRGLAIVLVEHDFPLVRRVADRLTVLEAGRVIAEGEPDAVARDPAVVEAYVGRPQAG